MKTPSSRLRKNPTRVKISPTYVLRSPVWVACVAVLSTLLHAQPENQLSVNVRSQLDRQKNTLNGKVWDGTRLKKIPDAPEHGKVYGILLMQPTKEVYRELVKPVDEAALKNELVRQMDSHGFQHAGPTRRPEILLVVTYGRSWLPNPYYSNEIDVDNTGPELNPNPFDGVHGQQQAAAAVDDVNIANRLKEIGAAGKATRSGFEKLFIMVRAWKNPTDPKEKPQVLWVCTMLVDDPDHLDLNTIAKQMLEAGTPFFDQEIKGVEAEIIKPLRDGHVNVGTPEVVQNSVPKSK